MRIKNLTQLLRFYFITDDQAPGLSPMEQVKIAIRAGATFIQYRNKSFSLPFLQEAMSIRNLCKRNSIPFVVNDNILLAKAVAADGVHLGQEDETPSIARQILGPDAIIGISVSNLNELKKTDLKDVDYIGTGPVFPTKTKKDAKKACGLAGLEAVVKESPLPVIAIGGIDDTTAASCFSHGAVGVAFISFLSRAQDPVQNALELGKVCGCPPRPVADFPKM